MTRSSIVARSSRLVSVPLATLKTSSVASLSAASTFARAMSLGEHEVHRLRAVAEDQRRLAGGDALHPAHEHLGVDAVDVHPRAVDVEVAQRDVVEAVHRVERAQQALVEDLGGAVERVVVVRVVVLGRREVLGEAVDRRRRRGDELAHAFASTAASITLNVPSTSTSSASRGSSAHCVIRSAAWWKTTSMPRVSSRTSARSQMSPSTTVTGPLRLRPREVVAAPAHEVVEHDDLAGALARRAGRPGWSRRRRRRR